MSVKVGLCHKASYATEEAALLALEDVRHERTHGKKRKAKKVECRVYLCQCMQWHLTSQKRWKC
jgi:hypothetical protein